MYFNNKEEVINKLESLQIIGDGSQGTCYLDSKKSLVYKIFHQFLDDYEFDEKIKYTSCEFLRFNHISNNTQHTLAVLHNSMHYENHLYMLPL